LLEDMHVDVLCGRWTSRVQCTRMHAYVCMHACVWCMNVYRWWRSKSMLLATAWCMDVCRNVD
jgi:hypothetical protein